MLLVDIYLSVRNRSGEFTRNAILEVGLDHFFDTSQRRAGMQG